MPVRNVAIRLGVEGDAEVRRRIEDTGNAGEQALQKIVPAAEAAGAAVDRQTARWERMAKAARDAETASRAQSNVNALLGVGQDSGGSARDSATVFEMQARAAEEAQRQSAALSREMAGLRAQFVPLAEAADRYQKALADIDRAQASGAISGSQAVDARIRETRVYEDATSKIERMGAAQKAAVQASVNRQTIVPDRGADIAAYGDEMDRLRAKYSPLFAAQQQYLAQLAEIRQAAKSGALAQDEAASAIQRSKDAFAGQVRDLAKGGNTNYRDQLLRDISFQGKDFFESVISGSSPSRAFLQQAPQVGALMAMGNLGPKDVVSGVGGQIKGLAEGAVSAVKGLGLVGGAIAAVATAVTAGAVAWYSYASSQKEVEQRLSGIGRASGVTTGQINALASSQAASAGMGRGETRDVASIYVGSGRVELGNLGAAVGATKDLSAFLGKDKTESAEVLADALGDVSKGAGDLASKYGLLSAAQVESIQRMDAQGNRFEAQRRLIDAVRDSTKNLAAETTGWAKVTQFLGTAWDATGQAVDKALTGGTLDERLASAKDRLAQARSEAGSSYLAEFGSGYSVKDEEKNVAQLQKLVDARNATAKLLQDNLKTQQVAVVIRSLQPEREELKRLTDQGVLLRKALSDPLSTSQIDEAKRAYGTLSVVVKSLVEDIEKFGSRAVAEMNRAAEFANKMVGATAYARNIGEINKRFDLRLRNTPESEKAGVERARQIELDTARKQSALDENAPGGSFSRLPEEIKAQILAAAAEFKRAPSALIAAIADIESSGNAGVGFSKSKGEDGRVSSAYGLGQITRGAEQDIRDNRIPGFDRTDPSTMAKGIAAYLDILIERRGGDRAAAVGDYFGSSDPAKRAEYVANVFRKAGELGDASTMGQVREIDAGQQALKQAGEQARITAEFYGKNGLALEAAGRASQKYQEMLSRGIPPNEALAASLLDLETKTATVAQKIKLIQFANDNTFEISQLGRDRTDAAAYARARSVVGDTDSPAAQLVIQQTRRASELTDAKSMITDGATSIVQEFRRTGDAAGALSNAFGSAADRLLAKLIDSGVSSLFNMATGGSSTGFLGGLLGSGSSGGGWGSLPTTGGTWLKDGYVPGFANGNVPRFADGASKLSAAGIVYGPGTSTSDSIMARISTREGIIKASSVEHYGADFIRSINDRTLRFADGYAPKFISRDVVAAANANQAPQINAPINVTMQGSSGDPATDKAHIDATVTAMREEMRRVFHQEQSNSLRQNGALWQAGVRRAS